MAKLEQYQRQMWTDAYRLYEKYHGQPPEESIFERLMDDMKSLVRKHDCHQMMLDLVVVIWDELDRAWKATIQAHEAAEELYDESA